MDATTVVESARAISPLISFHSNVIDGCTQKGFELAISLERRHAQLLPILQDRVPCMGRSHAE